MSWCSGGNPLSMTSSQSQADGAQTSGQAEQDADEAQRRAGGDARRGVSGSVRLGVASVVGAVVGLGASLPGTWRQGLLAGWIGGAAAYLLWTWLTIWPMDSQRTNAHALREDPGAKRADVVVVVAALASLIAVGLLLTGGGGSKFGQAGISVLSVALAWAVVHTNFTLRYARLYYTGEDGGIDFNEDQPPQYSDFAYLAFTVGMTFQVSDTDITTKTIRATALRQGLIGYLFGAVIIASVINLVARLGN